jgi:hypothetical protein
VPDDELASIDEAAGPNNRASFILTAAREAVVRLRRERLDAEVGRVLAESAEDDLATLADWSVIMADSLE